MKEYKYILLDLDGTITDPMIGITRCVEYALNHFGIQVNDLRELCPFIGPPLLDSFRDFYHFTDEQAKEATEKYRERFADTGIYENKLYDGMKDFLEEATRQGRILMLATSKPTVILPNQASWTISYQPVTSPSSRAAAWTVPSIQKEM